MKIKNILIISFLLSFSYISAKCCYTPIIRENTYFVINTIEGIEIECHIINEDEKKAEIVGLATSTYDNKLIETLTIPSKTNDFSIVSIKERAFEGEPICNVIISEGIVCVGENAFNDCFHMKSVILPSTIKTLSYGCFMCENMEKVVSYMNDPFETYNEVFDHFISVDSPMIGNTKQREESESSWWAYGVYDYAILYVPVGSISKYKTICPWAYFKNIKEFDLTDNVVLINNNSCLYNSIYDLSGRRMNAIPEQGIYIQDGKKVIK